MAIACSSRSSRKCASDLPEAVHVALNLGAEIPLSDQPYDWRAHRTLLWDFADGGFFKGWGK